MIQIELTHALALYAIVLVAFIIAIWVYTEVYVHRPQGALGRQFLWRCSFCGSSYLDESAKRVSRCPRCKSYNALENGDDAEARTADDREKKYADDAQIHGTRNPSRQKRHHQRNRGPRKRR